MSKTKFTDEQLSQLRMNPHVYSVTPSKLSLTKEFKEIFLKEYNEGLSPSEILDSYGLTKDLLGQRRIYSISNRIRAEYDKYGEFHEGYHCHSCNPKKINKENVPGSTEHDIKQLQKEVNFLKQEM